VFAGSTVASATSALVFYGVAAFGSLVSAVHPFQSGLRTVLLLIALASAGAAAVWARAPGDADPATRGRAGQLWR
jgi:hypothetical protein